MFHLAKFICGALFAAASVSTVAAGFPDRQVTIVVPYAPGGVTDFYARALAAKLTQTWNQPVIVDNKAGGGTVIGTQYASRAAADGYTLLLTSYAFTSNPVLRDTLPYKPASLTPLMLLGNSRNMLVLTGNSSMKTLEDVIARAKSSPGALKLASSGNASSPHIAAELFAEAIGADITHLPYRGTGPAMNDVIGGQVDGIFDGPSAMPNVRAGKLRAIAITSETRHPAAPEVPTFRELGLDLVFGSWFGFFVPEGTPAAVQEQLNADIRAALKDPEVQAQFSKTGLQVSPGSPKEFADFLEVESNRLKKLVAAGAKITVE
jgi:tripartite-type tricarboxylate transporter receptor subunit TctC